MGASNPDVSSNGLRGPVGLRILAGLLAVASVSVGCVDGPGSPGGTKEALAARLDSLDEPSLTAVYGEPALPLWVSREGLNDAGRKAIAELRTSAGEGLDPDAYGLSAIEGLRDSVQGVRGPAGWDLAALETALTRALTGLSADLARGRLAESTFDPGWQVDSLDRAALPDSATGPAILAHLDAVRPDVHQYERLQELLAHLRVLEDQGGWGAAEVPEVTLEIGDSAAAVAAVRVRLAQSLDPGERALADRGDGRPMVYDTALARGVRHFQARHGLVRDGVVGPETAAALNTPVEERIRAVLVALERWRWLPASLGTPAVVVNIPTRRVHVLEEGRPVLSMKAIIGQRDWKTAVFQDLMERIVVNPYWNVPGSILAEETIPRARQDPSYLAANDFEVVDRDTWEPVPLSSIDWSEVDADAFPYLVRQKPGERNALGRVKFLFPNRFDIYLHDTPADRLFDERIRTFSHGCVRVERPDDLAHYLFRHAAELPPSRYDELKASDERHAVELDHPVPIYLIYQSTWVSEDGVPSFAPDVYRRDAEVRRELAALGGDGLVIDPEDPAPRAHGVRTASVRGAATGHARPRPGRPTEVSLGDEVAWIDGTAVPYSPASAFVLPGEELRVDVPSDPSSETMVRSDSAGTLERLDAESWVWTAPGKAGLHDLRVVGPDGGAELLLHVFVEVPETELEGGRLNGYRVGSYPKIPLRGDTMYVRPDGFVEVTRENRDVRVSPRFRLKHFETKQGGGFPRYVVLQRKLLTKLELIVDGLVERGYPVRSLHVMSGYRTPAYNRRLGNVRYSRHQWGDAADLFVDEDGNGWMDDLNDDGRVTRADARVLYQVVDSLDRAVDTRRLLGGLGIYGSTARHGPFVHADTRGSIARW